MSIVWDRAGRRGIRSRPGPGPAPSRRAGKLELADDRRPPAGARGDTSLAFLLGALEGRVDELVDRGDREALAELRSNLLEQVFRVGESYTREDVERGHELLQRISASLAPSAVQMSNHPRRDLGSRPDPLLGRAEDTSLQARVASARAALAGAPDPDIQERAAAARQAMQAGQQNQDALERAAEVKRVLAGAGDGQDVAARAAVAKRALGI